MTYSTPRPGDEEEGVSQFCKQGTTREGKPVLQIRGSRVNLNADSDNGSGFWIPDPGPVFPLLFQSKL